MNSMVLVVFALLQIFVNSSNHQQHQEKVGKVLDRNINYPDIQNGQRVVLHHRQRSQNTIYDQKRNQTNEIVKIKFCDERFKSVPENGVGKIYS